MPSIEKLRRTWFALVREAGIPAEDRHAVQQELTGQASTRDWRHADYRRAIAQLQRDLGQHDDHHAHVREDRPHGVASGSGAWATEEQLRYIVDLVAQVRWRVSPLAYVCQHLLAGEEHVLRRHQLHVLRDQGRDGADLWRALTRRQASGFIQALRRMTCVYPVEDDDAD